FEDSVFRWRTAKLRLKGFELVGELLVCRVVCSEFQFSMGFNVFQEVRQVLLRRGDTALADLGPKLIDRIFCRSATMLNLGDRVNIGTARVSPGAATGSQQREKY